MIAHHQQTFYESSTELLAAQRTRLRSLIGQRISNIWIATESDGAWFSDEPAVICCGETQLEIAVYQIGLMAMTWNTINLAGPANWLGCWNLDGDSYRWRPATEPAFANAIGKTIEQIQIADGPSGVDAVEFSHNSGVLMLYNAGDELGVLDSHDYESLGFVSNWTF